MAYQDSFPMILALSVIPPDIIPCLLMMMMIDGILVKMTNRSSPLIISNEPLLVGLRKVLESPIGLIAHPFLLQMLARNGMTLHLSTALLRFGFSVGMDQRQNKRMIACIIRRVAQSFLSSYLQIDRALQILTKPQFLVPPYQHLQLCIENISDLSDWDIQFKLRLFFNMLITIPDNSEHLPGLIALIHHLIITENPLWKLLKEVFIFDVDNMKFKHDPIFEYLNLEYLSQKYHQELQDACDSMSHTIFYRDFQQLLLHVPESSAVEQVPNEHESFFGVIERFMETMIENLSCFHQITFEPSTSMIFFSFNLELSADAINLSSKISAMIKTANTMSISSTFLELLDNMNYEDSSECIVYRALEILVQMILLIQQSNSAIYTYIYAYILWKTSEIGEKKKVLAIHNLYTNLNESDDFLKFDEVLCKIQKFFNDSLELDDSDQLAIFSFLFSILSNPEFCSLIAKATMRSTKKKLKKFAKNLMKNEKLLIEVFKIYANDSPKRWIKV